MHLYYIVLVKAPKLPQDTASSITTFREGVRAKV